jgi:hypothetical protein
MRRQGRLVVCGRLGRRWRQLVCLRAAPFWCGNLLGGIFFIVAVLLWRPAPRRRPLAAAAVGQGDRLDILRIEGALVIHVALHDNNTAVLKESPGWCLSGSSS